MSRDATLKGAFGFPKLGIAGAALSNVIANWIALVSPIAYVYFRRLPLMLAGHELGHLIPDPRLLWMLVQRGTPMGLETIIVQGAYFMLLILVHGYGEDVVAGYSAAVQLWGCVQMPAAAVAASLLAMSAQNVGAGRLDPIE